MSASASATPVKPVASRAAAAREPRGVALMVGGGLLLGTIGVFVEEAGQHPLTTVWFRCAFGGLALLLWGAASGRLRELRLRGRGLAAALLATGLAGLADAVALIGRHCVSGFLRGKANPSQS